MGRYAHFRYNGKDLTYKFWTGVQNSDDATKFGGLQYAETAHCDKEDLIAHMLEQLHESGNYEVEVAGAGGESNFCEDEWNRFADESGWSRIHPGAVDLDWAVANGESSPFIPFTPTVMWTADEPAIEAVRTRLTELETTHDLVPGDLTLPIEAMWDAMDERTALLPDGPAIHAVMNGQAVSFAEAYHAMHESPERKRLEAAAEHTLGTLILRMLMEAAGPDCGAIVIVHFEY